MHLKWTPTGWNGIICRTLFFAHRLSFAGLTLDSPPTSQLPRRQRALARLRTRIDSGAFSAGTLSNYLLPLLSHIALKNAPKELDVAEEAVGTLRSLAAKLPWRPYHELLQVRRLCPPTHAPAYPTSHANSSNHQLAPPFLFLSQTLIQKLKREPWLEKRSGLKYTRVCIYPTTRIDTSATRKTRVCLPAIVIVEVLFVCCVAFSSSSAPFCVRAFAG